jgi:hypothetical protein
MGNIILPRPPQNDDELWWVIKTYFGVELPRVSVCEDHVSPFHAVAHAFFGREPNYAVWYASRGSGKSLALAVLGLVKSFVMDVDVTILGGSMTQSKNVAEHMAKLMAYENAPAFAMQKRTATELRLHTQKTIRPLPASQTTVRGPHPPLQLLDEVDEMEMEIYDASMGQAMEQENHWEMVVPEYIVASSTWQNPEGTFTEVIDRARRNQMPVFTWCWRELIKTEENPTGWMTRRFIDNKRKTVSAQMWKTEYELNEPSGASRVFDLDALENSFVRYPLPLERIDKGDEENVWIWEQPNKAHMYVVGADWAKEVDLTVIVVLRVDVKPYTIAKLTVVNKRPYPVMIGMFNRDKERYGAIGAVHDKTGLGNVVNDYVEYSDTVEGFNMVGRPRTEMLLDYVAAVEHGDYELPHTEIGDEAGEPLLDEDGKVRVDEQLAFMRRSHRSTTVAMVYAPGKWDSHLPDRVAGMALANRAVTRLALPTTEESGVSRQDTMRKVDLPFHATPFNDGMRSEGGVIIVDEREEHEPRGKDPFDLMAIGSRESSLDLTV